VLLAALGATTFQFVCFGGDGGGGYYDAGFYEGGGYIDPDVVDYWAGEWDDYIRM
jgi:hypothetical protein